MVRGLIWEMHQLGLTYKQIMAEVEKMGLEPPSHGFLSTHLGTRRSQQAGEQGAA